MSTIQSLADVLGNSLPVARTYGDGSFDCPFCHNAVVTPAETCANPWCLANPIMPLDAARKIVQQQQEREQQEAERKRNHSYAMARIQEDNDRRASWYVETKAEAERRGACAKCAVAKGPYGGKPRFVKHRNGCTK